MVKMASELLWGSDAPPSCSGENFLSFQPRVTHAVLQLSQQFGMDSKENINSEVSTISGYGPCEKQTRRYFEAIGSGMPPEIVDDLTNLAQNMKPDQQYKSEASIKEPFLWEVLVEKDWNRKVRPLVDLWVEVRRSLSFSKSTGLTSPM